MARRYQGHELPPTAHPDCGTYAAVQRHGKDNEALDPACLVFQTTHMRQWRIRTGRTKTVHVPVELVRQAVGAATGDLRTALLATLGETPESWDQWLSQEAFINGHTGAHDDAAAARDT